MKVAILGLLSKQITQLSGEFPYLDLRYQRAKHGAGEDAILRNADRILLMTKFTTHSLYDKLDKSKLININGGMTKLRETLAMLNDTARIATLPSITVIGREVLEEDTMAKTHNAKFDFSVLRHAEQGAEFTFTRPQEMSVDSFILAMQQGRSYYKRIYGVLSEQTLTGGKGQCRITVLKTAAQHEKETALQAPIEEIGKIILPPQLAKPEPESTLESAAAPPPKNATEDTRLFWREVFMQSLALRPSAPPSEHIACANMASDAWLARFG